MYFLILWEKYSLRVLRNIMLKKIGEEIGEWRKELNVELK
jgi:hypothetical protein